ncbi:YadA C-terminal domain-containing protein [Prochlorococcus sp. AH-736-K15]|nr:YadA C-terminal domain-containing protein [Prochlorococcus sp. AH-736-K15]
MKKIILSFAISTITLPLITEQVKADNVYNDQLQSLSKCTEAFRENAYAVFNHEFYRELADCDELYKEAINENANDISNISTNSDDISTNTSNISTNASDIDTNTTNITSNTSNISTNTSDISTNASAIETLQGSSNSADITANTNKINTNTSNINSLGEGVAGSTALTAALSALPQMSKESKTTCGVGTGAYSSRYAVGFGCASKVSKRIDINAGGSYVFGGSKSYGGGTLDSGVVKAGFVFKLGELNKPTQISLNESKVLKNEVKDLKAKNNQLLARLEKLENIALKFQSNSEMISVATKD